MPFVFNRELYGPQEVVFPEDMRTRFIKVVVVHPFLSIDRQQPETVWLRAPGPLNLQVYLTADPNVVVRDNEGRLEEIRDLLQNKHADAATMIREMRFLDWYNSQDHPSESRRFNALQLQARLFAKMLQAKVEFESRVIQDIFDLELEPRLFGFGSLPPVPDRR